MGGRSPPFSPPPPLPPHPVLQVDRLADGTIVADPARFPSGMAALAAYVHGRGLKFGLYTSSTAATCQRRPGAYGYEAQDAATYCAWGVDYLKVRACVRLCGGLPWSASCSSLRRRRICTPPLPSPLWCRSTTAAVRATPT